MKQTLLAFGLVAAALVPGAAVADTPPSVWQRARDPETAEAYALHRLVQQRLVRTEIAAVNFGEQERVLVLLERAGAEKSKSPLLRFDLGEVYLLVKNYARSAQVLKAALAEFPNHSAAPEGWLRLAFACGHLGDHECERKSYTEVLRFETEDLRRITPMLNLAETMMHIGDLTAAIEGYREVVRLSGRVPAAESAPLAEWGLAVALDRSGDSIGAEREARLAVELEHSIGHDRLLHDEHIVFFSPAYEIHWYDGLGAAAVARVATSARVRAAWWREAAKSYEEFIRAGERTNDRWLPIAKARLAQAKAERDRAAKAAEREPVRPAEKDFDL